MGRGSDTYPPALLWLPLIYGGARRQNVRSGNIVNFRWPCVTWPRVLE